MRCIEIAKAYEEKVGTVQFLVADEESKNFIESKGFSCYQMDSVWNDTDTEIEKIAKCANACQVKKLLVDSYFITKEYVDEWKKQGVKVAYLDDLVKGEYAVDVLFNGALWAKNDQYEICKNYTKLYLGCEYLPLRKEFAVSEKKTVKKQVQNVLVLSGGTDHFHFLLGFIDKLPEELEEACQFYLVCGIFNEDYEKILRLCEGRKNLHVLHNVTNLDEYMRMADVAISAGGMTLYELCACGTPTITYLMADNQKGNVDGFLEQGIFDTIGDIRKNTDYERLFEKLESMLPDYDKRKKKAKQIQELVDGKGAYRIAEVLKDM